MSDIVGIVDSSGNLIVRYTYDPWGRLISVESDLDQYERDIATLNPLRYRGYYYDTESGLYYLQSRYYDPEVGRFINCDDVNYIGVTETVISYNPFAYCENDPANWVDFTGYIALPGTIHKQVVLDIKRRFSNLEISKVKINYANGRYGYCDVINPKTGEIWEVKRQTVSMNKAMKQLNNYVNGTYYHNPKLKLKIGGYMKGSTFTYQNMATIYYVSYWYAGNGIIYYDYDKDSKLVPDPQVMEQQAMFLVAYYAIVAILTVITGGATAGGLVPVLV